LQQAAVQMFQQAHACGSDRGGKEKFLLAVMTPQLMVFC
jgi:hypothetical protein